MLVRRSRVERELDEELRLHVEAREAQLQGAGLTARDARRAARQRFGSTLRHREDSMDAWGWQWLEQLVQDVRFGARTLLRSPMFALTAIVTLGLATGATTAIFGVVNGVLLRPLPFDEPDRLVQIFGRNWREDRGGPPDPVTGPVVYSELEEAARQSVSFEGFAGYSTSIGHMDGSGGVERVQTVLSDMTLLELIGVQPVAGRVFRPGDPPTVAVIGGRLWNERFNRDPAIVGKAIVLDGKAFTIVGVMGDAFEFPYRTGSLDRQADARSDVWIPVESRRDASGQLQRGRVSAIARLKPGVSVASAAAELDVICRRIEQERYAGTRVRVEMRPSPLADVVLGPVRGSLWMLLVAVGLVLVTACTNVANLLLARMAARAREVVTRAALGAGTLRLVRQFLAESLLLSLAGGLLGMAIAWWGTHVLLGLYTGRLPRAHEVALDWQSFAFLLAACVITAGLFGLAPAFTAARLDAVEMTKESAGHATVSRKSRRLRDALVVVEVALAFVLAVGAALVIREIVRLQNTPSGMETGNVAVMHMTPRTSAADYVAIEGRVAGLPGVRGAGFIQYVPLENSGWTADFGIEGRPPLPGQRRVTELRYVTPGYFHALGIPILKGRGFTPADTAEMPMVVIVNQALARRYFPDEDPVGRVLDRGTIIGVVGDVRSASLGRPAEPELYYTVAQNVAMTSGAGISLVVRTTNAPEAAIRTIRSAVLDVNPKLAIFGIRTMEQVVDESLWQLHLYRWLIGGFAALTVMLAAVGLYGLIAYTASARTREFAIRLALGSNHRALGRLVLGGGLKLVAAGLALGAVCIGAIRWWLADLPGGIEIDLATPLAAAAVLVVIGVLACAVPALRAAAVDPITALRQE